MTKKDYTLIAKCITECHNKNYNLEDTISYFSYVLHLDRGEFDPTRFSSYILERTKPEYIPKEQKKNWAMKKVKKINEENRINSK